MNGQTQAELRAILGVLVRAQSVFFTQPSFDCEPQSVAMRRRIILLRADL
jgi:hypothetical protein